MNARYILRGKKVVACNDIRQWSLWYEENSRARHVADTHIGAVRVSTVFLGINHARRGGAPMLFETLAFGGPLDGEQRRCATWAQAERNHAAVVKQVKTALNAAAKVDNARTE